MINKDHNGHLGAAEEGKRTAVALFSVISTCPYCHVWFGKILLFPTQGEGLAIRFECKKCKRRFETETDTTIEMASFHGNLELHETD